MKVNFIKLSVAAAFACLMLPGAASAATESSAPAAKPAPPLTITQTKVNDIVVPGLYIITKDSRVALIPNGVGLVVVHKDVALPPGSRYLTKPE